MRSLTIAMALGLGACASLLSAQDPGKLPPSVTIDTVNAVTVRNMRAVPVSVYLEFGQFDRRLGAVKAGSTQTLHMPAWAYKGMKSVRLFVRPDGETADLASQDFELAPAAKISLLVPPRGGRPDRTDPMTEVIAPEELDDATLTVDNPNDFAVTVFAQADQFDTRLGVVPARGRETLRFPKSVVLPGQTLKVFVHPDGGLDMATETFSITKGQHLGLRVPPR